jgi:TBC1 domain family member 8/9
MRVASEVRRRMEEAQKELEKNALPGQPHPADEDDEDEDDGAGAGPSGNGAAASRSRADSTSNIEFERRSVRSVDRALLDGADAEAGEDEEVAKQGPSLLVVDPSIRRQSTLEFEG